MRAVVMQDRTMRLAELPEPVPGEGEVLVEVLACGICGSDLHCARHGAEFNASLRAAYGADVLDLDRPIVFGHEFVGRVLGHGPGTTGRVPIGARVVSVPSLTRPGRPFLGFAGPKTPGGFAERMVLSESLLLRVPEHVPTERAALTEPLAVAEHAVSRAGLRPGDVPLVVGCGPIGLAIIAVLRMRCDGPVVAADLSPSADAWPARWARTSSWIRRRHLRTRRGRRPGPGAGTEVEPMPGRDPDPGPGAGPRPRSRPRPRPSPSSASGRPA